MAILFHNSSTNRPAAQNAGVRAPMAFAGARTVMDGKIASAGRRRR